VKVIDKIFALFCGIIVSQISFDLLKGYGIEIGYLGWFLYIILPVVSVTCLWFAYLIGKKVLFVFQAAKYFLIGVFVTIVDLKLFEFLVWFSAFLFAESNTIIYKAISFLVSTSIKYWSNKHWAFEKPGKEKMKQEIFRFSIVTIVGLIIDTGSFFYFTKILGPQFGTPTEVWIKLSVIFAALAAAIWNFAGYKFLVFKK